MSSTAFNLLLAFLLLAANAFYVAAEFALVKSRGFRIKAMVEQDRFGARLLLGMMGAGKSTIGRRLAARLGLRFFDADVEIEGPTPA